MVSHDSHKQTKEWHGGHFRAHVVHTFKVKTAASDAHGGSLELRELKMKLQAVQTANCCAVLGSAWPGGVCDLVPGREHSLLLNASTKPLHKARRSFPRCLEKTCSWTH